MKNGSRAPRTDNDPQLCLELSTKIPMRGWFEVNIKYHMPTYDLHHGRSMKVHISMHLVRATTCEEAIKRATELFRKDESASGVRWVREVLSSHVRKAVDAEENLLARSPNQAL
jgi:hypothetical protein